jgi:hypothetical protein
MTASSLRSVFNSPLLIFLYILTLDFVSELGNHLRDSRLGVGPLTGAFLAGE